MQQTKLRLKRNRLYKLNQTIFQAILWAKSACDRDGVDPSDGKNIRSKLGTALNHIRFSLMRKKEFAKIVGLCFHYYLFKFLNLIGIVYPLRKICCELFRAPKVYFLVLLLGEEI